MRKGTIFKYELRRLFFSKEYLLLLVATLIFSVSLLRSTVLFGANYTAPFSPLTFCTYVSAVSPILYILLLVLCARQFTSSERGAAAIMNAVPMPASTFKLLRYGAIACAFTIAAALPLTACFIFYRLVFGFTAVGNLFWSFLLLLLPPVILLFGAAMLLGNKRSVVIYILLAAVLIFSVFQISLPGFIDIIGSPVTQTLNTGEEVYVISSAFIAGRMTLLVTGIATIILSLRVAQRKAF